MAPCHTHTLCGAFQQLQGMIAAVHECGNYGPMPYAYPMAMRGTFQQLQGMIANKIDTTRVSSEVVLGLGGVLARGWPAHPLSHSLSAASLGAPLHTLAAGQRDADRRETEIGAAWRRVPSTTLPH